MKIFPRNNGPWRCYQRGIWKHLRCSFIDKLLIISELKSHDTEARALKSTSPEEMLGNPKVLAESFNENFSSKYRLFKIFTIPCLLVTLACVGLAGQYYFEEWSFKLGGSVNKPVILQITEVTKIRRFFGNLAFR